ncbi:MAG: LamG-like jellyroll fold domain-containing protein [Flavobacteriales bacterium]
MSCNLNASNLSSSAYYNFLPTHKIATYFVNLFSKNKDLQTTYKVSVKTNLNLSKTIVTAVVDVTGDFRSNGNGDWTDSGSWETWDGSAWVATAFYPGQNSGNYTVTIQAGNTITISTNFTTQSIGDVIIDGTLILGDGTSSQHETTLTTELIRISSTGTLTFDGNKVRLILHNPTNSAIIIEPSGTIDGDCTNNDEIFIGTNKYATCVGSGSTTYSFGDIVASGGTINSEINIPSSNYITESCSSVSLEGTYTGSITGTVNYQWYLLDPDGITTSLTSTLSSNISSSSFTPTKLGDYLVSLEVNDDNYTNVETRIVTVEDTTAPVITLTGAPTSTLEACADTYTELGATVTDCETGLSVTVGGDTVDTSAPGVYTVTYNVTDTEGNAATQVTRVVTVEDTTNPTITPGSNVIANTSDDGTGDCTVDIAIADAVFNDCSGLVTIVYTLTGITTKTSTVGQVGTQTFNTGVTTINYTVTDAAGNSTTGSKTVTVIDNELPTASNPAPIVASGSAPAPDITVVTDEADNCTANPQVAWVSDTPSGTCPVVISRLYSVTDNAGNSRNVTQTITVNDAIAPIASCIAPYTLTVTLDGVTGEATILPSDIDDGSTDNCGSITLSLDKDTFGCDNIGTNTVTLTVTDSQGLSDTCQTIITVNAPTINSGTLTGYNVQTETSVDASDIIEITACPIDPVTGDTIQQDVLLTLSGIDPALNDDIARWEYSTNGGVNWSPISHTATTYTLMDVQVTTMLRAVINVGDCLGFSPVAIIAVIPPDIPPTITNNPDLIICLGEAVTVEVESAFGVGSNINEGGLFQIANPEDWRINGIDEWKLPASSSAEKDDIWAEITNQSGGRNMNGTLYNAAQPKYIIVHGDLTNPEIKRQGKSWNNTWSSLETPIFSLYGLTDATLTFDTAYFLEAGAEIKVEISTDGGATYEPLVNPLDPGINTFNGLPHDFSGPSTSGVGTHMENFVPIEINLQNYIGIDNLRIRFYFEGGGTLNSSWALDNVEIPNRPVDEVIEWTDDNGVVVETGSTVNITPITPGIQNYGATSLINGCRSDDTSGTEFVTIEATLSYAGENIIPITNECGEDTVILHAYDNTLTAQQNYDNGVWDGNYKVPNMAPASPDYPGTGEIGTWSVTSAPTACGISDYSFSDVNDPNAIFTGVPGTYTLAWTVNGCASNLQVTINSCSQIDFDGVNDYVTFKDNYDKTGPFSIEMWVKAGDLSGTQSLFSKRDANDLSSGYDLRLNGGSVEFHWGNNSITSNAIDATTWHHIAVTFNGSTYKLYMNGVEKASANGSAPTPNDMECLLGAMDQANNPPNKPINYYHGWIDELRIWNKALDVEHIHQMMNQEIKLNGGDDVMGEIIPLKIYGQDITQDGIEDNPLLWSNLDGYYRMDLNCGYLTPTKGSLSGRLRNINSAQEETAPLPYRSANNGLWGTNSTWEQPIVWYPPNSTVNGTQIDWNIVETSHNITSNAKDLTLLGLLVKSNELTITNTAGAQDETNSGHGLWITHYLKLDGKIDLVGESQLVQKRYNTVGNPTIQFNESILDVTSSGDIERDQQGTVNKFNYNYWSSPVGAKNATSNNNPATLLSNKFDGTNTNNPQTINWRPSGYDASPTNPLSIPEYWLWAFENYTSNTYSKWVKLNKTSSIKPGLGYTMKGSGSSNTYQNYTFIGKPNNGTINRAITIGNEALIGNPYPSAIDANEFIKDNIPAKNPDGSTNNAANPGTTGSIDGTLNFWIHYESNNSHVLRDYQGGYATYTLIGGNPPVSSPLTTTDGYEISGGGNSTLQPGRYIPVGQGFFVYSAGPNKDLNFVKFQNSQRVFQRETNDNSDDGSQFLKQSTSKTTAKSGSNPAVDDTAIKRIRFQFKSPESARRHLLLGFTNNEASDGFDYGYDAKVFETLPSDMLFMINDGKYTIQAVGAFDQTKQYPFGIFLKKGGAVEISIPEMENLDPNTKVYIYDSLLETYTKINDKNSKYSATLEAGNHLNRFFITFMKNDTTLSLANEALDEFQINYLSNSKEILIQGSPDIEVKQVYLINILGQTLKSWNKTNLPNISNDVRIPVGNVSEGNYIVKVVSSYGTISKKVIISQ